MMMFHGKFAENHAALCSVSLQAETCDCAAENKRFSESAKRQNYVALQFALRASKVRTNRMLWVTGKAPNHGAC